MRSAASRFSGGSLMHLGILPAVAEIGSGRSSRRPAGRRERCRSPAPACRRARGSWECPWESRRPGGRPGGRAAPRPAAGPGKSRRQLAADRGVHAVVVVGVEEPALLQIAAQRGEVAIAPADVAVARHIDVGHVPEVVVAERDDLLLRATRSRCGSGSHGVEQVGKAGGIGVPVAAAVVVQAADRHDRGRDSTGGRGRRPTARGRSSIRAKDHGSSMTSR